MHSVNCDWFPNLPSGSWADWATALVALLALGAAVWAGRAAWLQNMSTQALLQVERLREDRAERAERQRADAEARAHQADQVAVWTVHYPNFRAHPSDIHVAEIRNQSLLPIYDVSVMFLAPDGEAFGADETFGVIAPGAESVPIPGALLAATTYRSPEDLEPGTRYRGHDLDRRLRVAIWFRDTAGRQWHRDHDGYLNEVTQV